MVRAYLSILCILAAGCSDPKFREPIRLAPHGDAVRANMAAHIINPNPPPRSPTTVDASRTVLATDRYRKGEVKLATDKKKESLTGAEE